MHASSWKWFHYYWNFAKHFGREFYRTWRQELFASIVVTLFVVIITGDWTEFRTVLLANACTLGAFAVWHLLRVPWLLHRSVHGAQEHEPGSGAGILGILVIVGVFAGGYKLAAYLYMLKPVAIIETKLKPLPVPAEIPTPCPSKPSAPHHTPNLMSSAELKELVAGGLRVGGGLKEAAQESGANPPFTFRLSEQQSRKLRKERRDKFHDACLPWMKRAQQISAQIVAQDPPLFGSARQTKNEDKKFADFFRGAVDGRIDYDEADVEAAARYLIDISKDLEYHINLGESPK